MKDIVKVKDIVEATGLYSASHQNRMRDLSAEAEQLAGQDFYKGIPFKQGFINPEDCLLNILPECPIVSLPGAITEPFTKIALTQVNHLLQTAKYDFYRFYGQIMQPGYAESIQQELADFPRHLLTPKLNSIFTREFDNFCNLYNLYYFRDFNYFYSLGFPTPLEFRGKYGNYCNSQSMMAVMDDLLEKIHYITSPLDQFSILPLIPMKIGNLYFSFTNSSLFMLLTLSFVLLLIHFVTKKGGGNLVPNAWQSLVELIYDFVLNLVNEQIGGLSGNVKQKFFPCILVTFTFLLFCNLQGMIPYSFTVTSHFLITLGLSFSIFIGITIVGFQRNGLHFLSFLLPAGVPLPLAPFLVLLELISYCFRALSLGIRLFANMMAGHSLVKILSGFAWTMLCMNEILYFIGDLGPLFIVLALTGLELGVAILQAYVFTILICIYLNDAINLH